MCFLIPTSPVFQTPPAATCHARTLDPEQRQQLALKALAGTVPVSELAQQAQVSRKFVYQQKSIATEAIDSAFHPSDNDKVLFHLPVTKHWLRQFILGLVLIGHCPLRAIVELFRDFFDYDISLGTVHNIVRAAARQVNSQQDLSAVRVGAHDEIFQKRQPVLVGVDALTSYCYLLSLEAHRDADTWGVHLLDLQPAQLDRDFAALANAAQVAPELLRELFALQNLDRDNPQRWYRDAILRQILGKHYFPLSQALEEVRHRTVRASSVVENLNSRLRDYFFLRQNLGNDYLALLQFFLNHRRFVRSEHPERVNKSPTELLTRQTHPHWVELLGYTRFSRN